MCCWPLFMRRGRARAFPSGSTRPDYAAPVWCCNMAGCCYGVTLSAPVTIFGMLTLERIPVQIFEAAFEFVLFAALLALEKKRPQADTLKAYLLSYAAFRFAIEFSAAMWYAVFSSACRPHNGCRWVLWCIIFCGESESKRRRQKSLPMRSITKFQSPPLSKYIL